MTNLLEGKSPQEVQEADSRLSDVLESVNDVFVAVDRDWRITHVNSQAARVANKRRQDLLGHVLWDEAPMYRGTEIEAALRAAMDQGKPVRFEFCGAMTGRWFELSAYPSDSGMSVFARDIDDRKQAERSLRASEERFRQLADAMPQMVWTAAPNGRVTFINRQWHLYTGLTLEQTNQIDSMAEVLHAQDAPVALGRWAQSLASGEPHEVQSRFKRRADGAYRWFLTRAVPTRDEDGRVREWFGTATDIHDQKLAEQRLRASEERFRRVSESGLISIAFFSAAGEIVDANDAFLRMVGYSREELRDGQVRWDRLTPPEWMSRTRGALEEFRATGRISPYEKEYFRRDGSRFWGLFGGARIGEDSSSHGVAFVMDVTERKRAEERLRASERLYSAIGESIEYGVWVCDPQGRNIYASDSFLRLVGMTQEECAEFGWGKVLHPDDAERTIAAWKECVRTGGQWDIEHRYRGVDGEWHHVLARGVPVRDERGEITAWAGINLDIGRQKQVEAELREAHHRKDEFLATLAHELRNPLAPLRNGLEILRLAKDNLDAAERARGMMERQLQQMVRLIDDLLDLSRISRGNVELRKEAVDLAVAVQQAVETSRPLIEQSSHELSISVPPERVFVHADLTRLAQVVANLLNNAAKYTEKGGRIVVAIERRGSEAVVAVKDNGRGIPAHMLARVFDTFTQVDRQLENTYGGLGIGLSIVRRLVQMHGGLVEARSDGPGMGSEFVVRLPLLTATVEEKRVARAVPAAPAPTERRVLIADDNEDAAASLAMMFKLMGNDVRTARDGLEAVEVARLFRPGLILLDIGMPKADGYEACRRIRGQPWGRDVRIVALTGWGQAGDKRQSREAGFDEHLVKPVEPDVLEQMLQRVAPAASVGEGAE